VWRKSIFSLSVWCVLLAQVVACSSGPEDSRTRITLSGSRVGREAEILRQQLRRFEEQESNRDLRVEVYSTPDAADQRHQLYVGWLLARDARPDILQLDVIWVAEFAQAGWILPLEEFRPELDDWFPAVLEADRFRGRLYAVPWFVDVGMLYWRTDLLSSAPDTLGELAASAERARRESGIPYGLVWQGARYEGLVTVFLEYLTAFGGRLLDDSGRVALDSPAGVRALTEMRRAIEPGGIVPREALTWTEETTRFAFQNGQAVFMRNWPYAYPEMQKPERSKVSGRFAVVPVPAAEGGRPSAALGGQQLAINAHSLNPSAAYRVIEFLTRPDQMRERAQKTGQYPPRPSLYRGGQLAEALAIPPDQAVRIIESAVSRPSLPAYSEVSEALQIHLHRALEGSEVPAHAIAAAAREMQAILDRTRAGPERDRRAG
jgi:multiple sugar transport system substrate-binding protein